MATLRPAHDKLWNIQPHGVWETPVCRQKQVPIPSCYQDDNLESAAERTHNWAANQLALDCCHLEDLMEQARVHWHRLLHQGRDNPGDYLQQDDSHDGRYVRHASHQQASMTQGAMMYAGVGKGQ